MSAGVDVNDAYGQPVFSTSWQSPVLGGSTRHTGVEKVSVCATASNATYYAQLIQLGYGGIVDFRIEDTAITDDTDTAVNSLVLPFVTAPMPIAVTHVYKAVKSGAVNAGTTTPFNANASSTESSVTIAVVDTAIDSQFSRSSGSITGLYVRSNPGVNNPTDLPNCGTLAMAKRNRMVPHLFIGDQFQLGPFGGLDGVVAGRESVNYEGSGTTYTVTRVEFVTTSQYRVYFTPKASSMAAGQTLYVQGNLNKLFVRAAMQIPANNVTTYYPPSSFDMYYFRKTRNSDAVNSGFGMQTYDANGNVMFTTNKRILELSALGVTSLYTNTNFSDPNTGDLRTENFIFGSTPTYHAYYAPVVGRGRFNWNSSLTTGSGFIQAYNSSNAYGLSAYIGVGCRVVAGSSQFKVCKIGPQLAEESSGSTPLPNDVRVNSNSPVMVIDTTKYQP